MRKKTLKTKVSLDDLDVMMIETENALTFFMGLWRELEHLRDTKLALDEEWYQRKADAVLEDLEVKKLKGLANQP